MSTALQDLVSISRYYGANPDFVIAGGGNTSYKDDMLLYVKASGVSLATINEDGFAVLNRKRLAEMMHKHYSDDPIKRETEIKNDLAAARANPESTLRPSVEASLHDLISYRYVVHTHPTMVNALMCSVKASSSLKLFPDALFITYTDPGYTLSKKVEFALGAYRAKHKKHPHVIFLENHGIFVGADTTGEIKKVYENIVSVIRKKVKKAPSHEYLPIDDKAALKILPAVRMLLSESSIKIVSAHNSELIQKFAKSIAAFNTVAEPYTPDNIVYCKSHVLYSAGGTPEAIVADIAKSIPLFKKKNGYMPKVIIIKDFGIIGADDSARGAETVLAVFEDVMKIAAGAASFGGPNPMTKKAVAFIDNWEVENYRRAVAKSGASGRAMNKIAVVTGAAQGFGEGIAQSLFDNGANVVIADLNEEKGTGLADKLNALQKQNRALFVKTDVSSEASVSHMTAETVKTFGGLDVFVSNAGVLRAGGLDQMDAKTFDFMTRINYSGYFVCAKYASAVMKTQHAYRANHFADIIQINSKSGLEGSNKNFAYAGGKFGGIGLTQSFALELMPHNIKVNSICPGNFFDGPLWSDPVNGLFVQYLKAKKVPGAKTVADVKLFYESKVPAKRGCTVPDVMKALFYIMEQEYETGQAVPVTGGQVMLK